MHFAARRQPDTPEITEILYYHWDHSESCKASTSGSALTLPSRELSQIVADEICSMRSRLLHLSVLQAMPRDHRISPDLRKEVLLQRRLGLPARDIMYRNQNSYIAAMMAEGKVASRDDALKTLSEQQMPRDFYLSLQDIANISRTENRETWRLAENPQESVLLWAAQNPDKVLYMHGQQPLQGIKEYDLVASMRQQATQRASMRACSTKAGQPEKNRNPGSSEIALWSQPSRELMT